MTGGNNTNVYTIRRIDPVNVGDMNVLYEAVYKKRIHSAHFQRMLAPLYTGIEYVGLIAYDTNGKPVASLCLVPCFIADKHKKILAAQLTDGMTHPEHRKEGLFTKLIDGIILLAKENGIQFIFGFPNQDAAPVLLKAGLEKLHTMDRFMIPLYGPFERLFNLRRVRHLPFERGMALSTENGFANPAIKEGFAGVVRNADYFNYIGFRNTLIQSVGSAKAWISVRSNLAIGDMEIEENNFKEMISKLRSIGRMARVKKMYFQSSPGTKLHTLFSKYYIPVPSFSILYKNLGPDKVDHIRFSFADIDVF
ncbi:MAG: GNAT family N-acetyltransferase [Chitinophagaceae bacterium]